MKNVRPLVALLAGVAVVFGGWLGGTGTRADDPAKEPAKGQLRPGWGKVGLSADQVEKVFKVQAAYRDRIGALEKQLQALKDEQLARELDVLTEAQKKHLADLEA